MHDADGAVHQVDGEAAADCGNGFAELGCQKQRHELVQGDEEHARK